MKSFRCSDVVAGCDWEVQSDNEQEILDRAAEHGREKHGLKEFTQELKDKVRAAIRDVKAA